MLHSLINAARAKVHNARAGFTLIELLVVIVLLGILMAIAVPTFQNAQQRGQAASAQSELKTAYDIAQGEFSYQANGEYPSTNALISKMEESEDEIQFVDLSVAASGANSLNTIEDLIDTATASTPANFAGLADDSLAAITALTPSQGNVGVQVFNFTGNGQGTTDDADDTVPANPTDPGAGNPGDALLLSRQDVSRNQVTWWVISNRSEGLPDRMVGAFYGSTRDGFEWKNNDQ